ncbi:uncharacterized protein LOC122732160 [Dromiciops gliroides]|uniref:uncharacterized protein LOC122732160 n=1 Tax=Dromiciops gliroides TaxID=33562 RepID=UPI001CC4DBF0|nr:uncharacterized protein LOC122732160 [Dromiciops gliroides]
MVAPAGLQKAGTARARQHHSSLERLHTPAIRPGGGGGGCSGGGTRATRRATAPDRAGRDGGCLRRTVHSLRKGRRDAQPARASPVTAARSLGASGHHHLSEPAPSPILLFPPRPPLRLSVALALLMCEQLLLVVVVVQLLLPLLLLLLSLSLLLLPPRRTGSAHFRVQAGTTPTANDGPVMQALKWLERALPPRRLFLLSWLRLGRAAGYPGRQRGEGFKAAFLGSDAIAFLTPPSPPLPAQRNLLGEETHGWRRLHLFAAGRIEWVQRS